MMKYIVLGAVISGLISMASGAEERSDQERIAALEQQIQLLSDEVSMQREMNAGGAYNPLEKFRFGGYGDVHANFEEGGDHQFDIHRLVLYVGYDFADWIMLTSEVELEHAFVADSADGDNGGEISIEQLYVDFLLGDSLNVRAGRVLAPLGIINQNHEPNLFLGVERPSVDRVILPTTWSLDGIGIFGRVGERANYQLYVVGGLDGSGFTAGNGIRGGRIKERGGLNDPAITGRVDFFPSDEHELRVGVSGYYGGTDNANQGGGNALGTDNDLFLYSADFEYDLSRYRFRGVVAHGIHSDVENLPTGAGEEIFGWYLECGASVMPDDWKQGKLEEADLIPFVRFEQYDTQFGDPAVGSASGDTDRTDLTLGVNMPLTYQLVVKADIQIRMDEAGDNPDNLFNLGMGWAF